MVNELKRAWRIVWVQSKNIVKSTWQNKLGIILFTSGKIIRFCLFFSFAYYLIAQGNVLKGYTVNYAILFYLTYNIVDTISQFLFREVYRFPELSSTGRFDNVLTKPMHPFLKVLVGGIDILDFILLVPYTLLTIFFVTKLQSINPLGIFLYFTLILNAVIISASFHILVLCIGILTTKTDQAMWIYRDISELGRFPFEIYTPTIRAIFTFAIPIGIMMTFPPKALFGVLSPAFVAYAFGFAILVFFAAIKFWDYSVKKYQSFGG